MLQKIYIFDASDDFFFFMVRAVAVCEPLNVVFASRQLAARLLGWFWKWQRQQQQQQQQQLLFQHDGD